MSTKVAVVGAGYWGPNLIRNFAAKPNCSELWVCERDAERLGKIQSRYPALHYTDSYSKVLESDVDAVVIATSVGTHFELANAALDAGKHVFVEKPLASSVDEAQALMKKIRPSSPDSISSPIFSTGGLYSKVWPTIS
ncbi:MAG: Gfo/Idh/MocA family oxidoreductase [Myxococcota bacterium]